VPSGNGLVPGRGVAVPDRVALAPDPLLGEGDVEVSHLGTAHDLADLVVLVGRRGGRRAHLGDAQVFARLPVLPLHRHPHQQVGEGEVGQQLPVPGQPVQVVDVGRLETGVLLGQITQR
jgi:hypothetical protein